MANVFEIALGLKDGVTPKFNAMSQGVVRFGKVQHSVMNRANTDLSRMMSTAKGFVVGSVINRGIQAVTSSVSGMVGEWVRFDNAARFAASKWQEVTTGALSYEAALAETKKTSLEVGGATMFTAGQVATAMDNMALSGWSLAQSQEAVGKVATFATLAQMDLTEATEAATGALGAFGLKSDDAEQLGLNMTGMLDKMTHTFTNSRMNLEQLSAAITAGGAAFVTSSQDISTFNTMVAAMAEGGIVAETAGMRMRAMINRLGKPTKDARKALHDLGVTVADAQGNFRPMLEIIGEMREGLAGKGTVERGAFIKTIFGERNITGINLILNKTQKQLEDFYAANAASAGAAAKQMERVQGSMMQRLFILKSAITEKFFTGFESGETPLAGAVSDLIHTVQNFDMGAFNEFIKANLPIIIDDIKLAWKSAWPVLKDLSKSLADIAEILIQMSPIIAPLAGLFLKFKVASIGFGLLKTAIAGVTAVLSSGFVWLLGTAIMEMGLIPGLIFAIKYAFGALVAFIGGTIGWIPVAIAAVAIALWQVNKNWDAWGDSIVKWWNIIRYPLAAVNAPLVIILDSIIKIRDNWMNIRAAFLEGGIINGLKAIGATIISSLLGPIGLLVEGLDMILAKAGKIQRGALSGKFQDLRKDLLSVGTTEGAARPVPLVTPDQAGQAPLPTNPMSGRPYFDASQYEAPNAAQAAAAHSFSGEIFLRGNTEAVEGTNFSDTVAVSAGMGVQ